jgi:hypothetical protein
MSFWVSFLAYGAGLLGAVFGATMAVGLLVAQPPTPERAQAGPRSAMVEGSVATGENKQDAVAVHRPRRGDDAGAATETVAFPAPVNAVKTQEPAAIAPVAAPTQERKPEPAAKRKVVGIKKPSAKTAQAQRDKPRNDATAKQAAASPPPSNTPRLTAFLRNPVRFLFGPRS